MLHMHYLVPSSFSCLISFLRSNPVNSCGGKISIVLRTEEETDHKRLKGRRKQVRLRPAFPVPVMASTGLLGRMTGSSECCASPSLPISTFSYKNSPAAAFLPGEIGLKYASNPLKEKRSHKSIPHIMNTSLFLLFSSPLSFFSLLFFRYCPWSHSLVACRSNVAHGLILLHLKQCN